LRAEVDFTEASKKATSRSPICEKALAILEFKEAFESTELPLLNDPAQRLAP
jgi:hypothetical protein